MKTSDPMLCRSVSPEPLDCPESALFFLTYRCNLRCNFCLSFNGYWGPDPSINADNAISPSHFIRPIRENVEVTLEQIRDRILPQLVKAGVTKLALSGGEVLARSDILEIFGSLGRTQLIWCFDSNLMLLTQEAAAAVVQAGCDAVFVSVDGPRETHNKLRGSDSAFQKTKRGIDRLRAARGQNNHPKIIINCVVQPGNERGLGQMVDIAQDLGADQLTFQLLSKLRYDQPFEVAAAHDALSCARRDAPNFVSVYPLQKVTESTLAEWYSNDMQARFSRCDYIYESFRIDPEGFVIPCIEHRMGNLLTQDLDEIWRGQTYCGFRQGLEQSGPLGACGRCCNISH